MVTVNPVEGTGILNGDLLRTAAAAAAALTPYGNPRSATNRPIIGLMPGRYNIGGGASGLTLATEFVDLIGLGDNPEDTVIEVDSTSAKILTQSSNDCRLANFSIYNAGNTAGFSMTNAAGHTATRHDNLVFDGAGASTIACMSYANFTNLGGSYRRCRSTKTRMYGGFADGVTCNAVFDLCEACIGSLSSSTSPTTYCPFSGRQTRCRLIPASGSVNGSIVLVAGAIVEFGYYKTTTAGQDIFKVTTVGGTSTPPIVHHSTIIAGTGNSIDRKLTEADGVVEASHLRMGANGIAGTLTNNNGTDAAAFNVLNCTN
jgi:hypothetical protein